MSGVINRGGRPSLSWSDERTERLRKLWKAGQSASQISKAFGDISRNAVLSKVNRMSDMGERAKPSPPNAYRVKTDSPADKKAKPAPPRPPKPAPVEGGVLLLDLKHSHCRWPLNGGDPWRFCGATKKPGSSYCPGHSRLAYVKPALPPSRLARSLRRVA